MSYLVSQLALLFVLAVVIGVLIGWLLRGWLRGSPTAGTASGDGGDLERLLAERDEQLGATRSELERRITELTAARRQIADVKDSMRDTVGMEAELIAAREAAAKVPALQAQVAQLTEQLTATSGTARPTPTAPATPAPPAPATDPAAPLSWAGDDLTELDGVTPELAAKLRARGIYSFAQLANLSPSDLVALDTSLGDHAGAATTGRWVAQAAERLAAQHRSA